MLIININITVVHDTGSRYLLQFNRDSWSSQTVKPAAIDIRITCLNICYVNTEKNALISTVLYHNDLNNWRH